MIGEKIKAFREQKKMSLSELAERSGVAKSYLSSIERNIQSNPSIQVLEKIAGVLGVSTNVLIHDFKETDKASELDPEWLNIVYEAMNSGISKEDFREYLEFNKWRLEKEQK
ncbi:helix-turn-helix domain-containing protein [Gracilibacillus dipsosauri]|uniref:helix-turn-helix domain-containing protein n=1 Tax=Gracilibacillus dipsosauri TaxID=178340 RepID=UPI00240A1681